MKNNNALKTIFILVAIACAIWFIWYIRQIVLYFILASVLTLMIKPLVRRLDKITVKGKHLPRVVTASVGMSSVFLVFFLIIKLFTPLISTEVESIRSIDGDQLWQVVRKPIINADNFLNTSNIRFSDTMTNREYVREQFIDLVNPNKISTTFGNVISGLGNMLYGLFVILFITFFLLKEDDLTQTALFRITPKSMHDNIIDFSKEVSTKLSRYFLGVLVETLLFGTLVSIGLAILGIENALVIGLLAGLLNVIPYVGPIIGGIIGVLIAGSTNLDMIGDISYFILLGSVMAVFIISQVIDNVVFQPIIYSTSVSAHPLEIFLVLMIAGQVGGIVGMVFGVPAYSTIRIAVNEIIKFAKKQKEEDQALTS